MTRRTRIGAIAGVLVVLLVLLGLVMAQPTRSADYEKELVFAFWGGRWEAALKDAVADFEREYGVKISWVAGSSVENLAKIQAQRARPQIDVAIMDDIPALQGKKLGVWAPLDPGALANRGKLFDLAKFPDNEGVGFGTIVFGLFYNKKLFAERKWPPPTSWLDLFRPEFKGHTIMTAMTTTAGVQTLLMFGRLHGGNERNLEPGWRKMKEFAQTVVAFPRNSPILAQHIERGEAWLGVWDNAATGHLASSGAPVEFVIPKEGAPVDVLSIHVIKGAPHPKVAQLLVNYILSEKTQTTLAQKVLIGPLNREVKLEPEVAARVVYGLEQIQKLIVPDLEYVAEQRPAWVERFTKEIATP
jgi:putative spermidine/putrescine transport system substrate-binding protein